MFAGFWQSFPLRNDLSLTVHEGWKFSCLFSLATLTGNNETALTITHLPANQHWKCQTLHTTSTEIKTHFSRIGWAIILHEGAKNTKEELSTRWVPSWWRRALSERLKGNISNLACIFWNAEQTKWHSDSEKLAWIRECSVWYVLIVRVRLLVCACACVCASCVCLCVWVCVRVCVWIHTILGTD